MASVKPRVIYPWVEQTQRRFMPVVKCKSHIICSFGATGLVFDWSKSGPRHRSICWINFFGLPKIGSHAVPHLKILGDE